MKLKRCGGASRATARDRPYYTTKGAGCLKLTPMVTVPCFKMGGGLDTNPAFMRSVRMLRRYGVRVLYEPETYPPKNQVPADVVLEILDEVIEQKRERS